VRRNSPPEAVVRRETPRLKSERLNVHGICFGVPESIMRMRIDGDEVCPGAVKFSRLVFLKQLSAATL